MHYILALGWSMLWAVSASLAWESLKREWYSPYCLEDLRTFLHGEIWHSCKVLWKPFWWQKNGKVY